MWPRVPRTDGEERFYVTRRLARSPQLGNNFPAFRRARAASENNYSSRCWSPLPSREHTFRRIQFTLLPFVLCLLRDEISYR